MFMLERKDVEADCLPDVVERGRAWFEAASRGDRTDLLASIMPGLPGAFDRCDIDGLRAPKTSWGRIAVHADDPPRDILGLPRVVSSQNDAAWVLNAHDSLANGLILCSSGFGAHPTNDRPAMAKRFGPRVHLAHLRNVVKDPDGSIEKAAPLDGNTDKVDLAAAVPGKVAFDSSGRPRLWQSADVAGAAMESARCLADIALRSCDAMSAMAAAALEVPGADQIEAVADNG